MLHDNYILFAVFLLSKIGLKLVDNWESSQQRSTKIHTNRGKQHPDYKKLTCKAEMWAQIDEECPEYHKKSQRRME